MNLILLRILNDYEMASIVEDSHVKAKSWKGKQTRNLHFVHLLRNAPCLAIFLSIFSPFDVVFLLFAVHGKLFVQCETYSLHQGLIQPSGSFHERTSIYMPWHKGQAGSALTQCCCYYDELPSQREGGKKYEIIKIIKRAVKARFWLQIA